MVQNHKESYSLYAQGRKLSKKFDALNQKLTDFFNDARTHAGRPELPPSPQHSGASSQTIPYEEWNTDIVPWSELEDVCSTFNLKGKEPIIVEDDEQDE